MAYVTVEDGKLKIWNEGMQPSCGRGVSHLKINITGAASPQPQTAPAAGEAGNPPDTA